MARLTILAAVTMVLTTAPVAAQEREVPYWASLRSNKVNMHVGPSLSYAVSWIYKRQQLPMKVLRLKEGWRLVEDPDGTRGWMLARMLSPEHAGLVRGQGLADMRASGDTGARLLWRLEPGVVGKLGDCDDGWCKFETTGHKGYVEQSRLWGPGEP